MVYLGLYPSLSQADTELVYTNRLNSVFGHPTIIQIQGSKVRLERNGSSLYVLYDHENQTLFNIDSKTQTFVRSTLETVKERTRKLIELQSKFTEQLKKQISELPESQRTLAVKRLEQAEKMLKLPQPTVTIEYLSKTDLILGKPCKLALFKVRSQSIREICYAPHTVIPKTDLKQLTQMFDFMAQLSQASAHIQDLPSAPINLSSLIFEDHLILKNTNTTQKSTEELAEIKTRVLDQQLFAVPEHYQELDSASAVSSNSKASPNIH